jgi:hypothetical protein
MFPDILSENMGNDIAKVHQNPLRSPPAFDAQRFGARTGEDTADMVRDGTRLAVRIRRTYNQVVGNRGQWGYLEDESIGGLLIAHGPGNGEGRRPSCSYDCTPLGRDDVEVYKIPLGAATDLPQSVLGGFERECPMRKSGRVVV